jgi:hypothetical protein
MTKSKSENKHEGSVKYKKLTNEAAEFHTRRINREERIEAKLESPIQPAGTDEYEQLVAENASLNAKPLIEEAAFLLAEQRGFAPGNELSDWLKAEAEVEKTLRKTVVIERRDTTEDRRHHDSGEPRVKL